MKLDDKFFKKKWFSYTIATCSAVVLYMILSNFSSIFDGINSFFGFLRPVILGMVIAYIFNPIAKIVKVKAKKNLRK